MKFLNDIFKRKAEPMAPIALIIPEVAQGPLEQLQKTITMHQSRLASMEAEAAQLGAQLGESGALSSKLKVRISEGDTGAAAQLDALEIEQREISRRREGLCLRIAILQSELAPQLRNAAELAAERDAKRQDALVIEITTEKDRLIDEILSHWTKACEDSFDLMMLLDSGMSGNAQQLDAEHKRQVFALNTSVGARLQAAALVHANEQSQFVFARSEVFRHLRITPAKRKEIARATG